MLLVHKQVITMEYLLSPSSSLYCMDMHEQNFVVVQESVDDVRAEVAAARSELQRFRSTRNNGRL